MVPRVVGWSPPPMARYNVNVDGAIFSAKKSAGVEVIIRDSNGQVIVALSRKLNATSGSLRSEG